MGPDGSLERGFWAGLELRAGRMSHRSLDKAFCEPGAIHTPPFWVALLASHQLLILHASSPTSPDSSEFSSTQHAVRNGEIPAKQAGEPPH